MTDMVAEVLKLAISIIENTGQRKGQAIFNAASHLMPKAAELARGTEIDPFYNDKKINSFIAHLYEIGE